jgi:hypothetical protein
MTEQYIELHARSAFSHYGADTPLHISFRRGLEVIDYQYVSWRSLLLQLQAQFVLKRRE